MAHARIPLDRRSRTAIHEAGHVVASLALGRKVRCATIVPDAGRLGTVRTSRLRRLDPSVSDRRLRLVIEREVIILMAGAVAEHLAGAGAHGGRRDRRDALELAGFVCDSEGERRTFVAWLRERARTILRARWPVVRAVSRALIEHDALDGASIRAIASAATLRQSKETRSV